MVEEEPKEEKKIEQKEIKVEQPVIKENNNSRKPRKGMNLYTINSNIKVGDKRYNITRIIEEKSEKMANILFDKTIKKELGKIKSSTKRTIRPYEEGDEDICNEIVEEVVVKEETDPKIIELNKKLKIIEDADDFFLFRVDFSKNIGGSNVMYFYQRDEEGVYKEIKVLIAQSLNEGDFCVSLEDAYQEVKHSVKRISKMTTAEIRVNKECLKKINDTTIEEMEAMAGRGKEIDNLMEELIKMRFKNLIENGYKFYEVIITNTDLHFVECAENEIDMASLASVEQRMLNLKSKEKGKKEISIEGRRIDIEATSIQELKDFVQKDDHMYRLLNSLSKTAVEKYMLYVSGMLEFARRKGMITEKNGVPQGAALSAKNLPMSKEKMESFAEDITKKIADSVTVPTRNGIMPLLNPFTERTSSPVVPKMEVNGTIMEKTLEKQLNQAQSRCFKATGKI